MMLWHYHCRADSASQQVVVVGQVLASEINIGFEDIVNTQVGICDIKVVFCDDMFTKGLLASEIDIGLEDIVNTQVTIYF